MSLGHKLSKVLRNVETEAVNERTQRAILLANALAFKVNLTNETLDSIVEAQMPILRKLAASINEHLALDVKVLEKLFVAVVKLRFELLEGSTNTALIQMAINSSVSELFLDNVDVAAGRALVSKTEFFNLQSNLLEVLQTETAADCDL